MSKQQSSVAVERIVLAVILLVGCWLRLGWPRVVSFGYDEARVSRLALDMAREGHIASVGMATSAGVPNFPGAVWLYSLPYLLSTDPVLAVWFTALANVLAVVGVWWLARRAWGGWSAAVAAALFATSPYLVFYSRGIWGQDWLAPGAVAWAVCLEQGLRTKRDWWIAGAAFLAGFLGQVHPAGFALVPVMVWVVVRHRLWRNWRSLVLGSGVAVLAAAPMLAHLLQSPGAARAYLDVMGQKATVGWTSLRQLAELATSSGWEWFWLGPEWRWSEPLRSMLWWLPACLAAAILYGALSLVVEWTRGRNMRETPGARRGALFAEMLLPWAGAAPLLFLSSRTPPYIQYQLTAVPALYLAAGAAVRSGTRRWVRALLCSVVLAVVVVQVLAVSNALNTTQQRQIPGGLGTPLLYAQQAAGYLRLDGKTIVVEAAGADPAFDGDATVFDVLLWGSERRMVDGRLALLLPQDGANILFTFDTLPAWEVASRLGIGVKGELPRRQGEPPYATLSVEPPYELSLGDIMPVRLANGARLVGWTTQARADGGIRLLTAWRIDGQATERYHQFNHLYLQGATGPTAVQDIYAQSAAWQAGDLLITWVDFPSVAGQVQRFEVGMYTYPGLQRVLLEDPGAGDVIRLTVAP